MLAVCSFTLTAAFAEVCNTRTVDASLTDPTACNGSVCGSLQAALLATFTGCIEILVPSGRHAITTPVFLNQSTRLIGTGDSVLVACSYSSISTVIPDLKYTLYFGNTPSVALENVQFVGCSAPLRFDGVSRLNISNCVFRYILLVNQA